MEARAVAKLLPAITKLGPTEAPRPTTLTPYQELGDFLLGSSVNNDISLKSALNSECKRL